MTRTCLYRQYDENENLLYVGISVAGDRRTCQHQAKSPWFDRVSTIKVEHFETRSDAEAAEKTAIKTENPVFNLAHNQNSRYPINETRHPNWTYGKNRLELIDSLVVGDGVRFQDIHGAKAIEECANEISLFFIGTGKEFRVWHRPLKKRFGYGLCVLRMS